MSQISGETQLLQQAATQAAENAYAPYSKFHVGAALLLTDGSIVTGGNVENISYGLTICAERSALFRAIAEKGPNIRVKAVAVSNLNHAASPPCGACRQVLSEFANDDAMIFFPAVSGYENRPFFDLFPFTFRLAKPAAGPS